MSPSPLVMHRRRGRPQSAVVFAALAIAALLIMPSAIHAQTTVYVDNQSATCSPTGPGTELSPFCSITAAAAAFKGAGITIIVKPGIYREQVTVPAAGASGSPYVFQAQGAGVVVDGSDDFGQPGLWVAGPGTSFLAASVTWTPKQVYVDGVRLSATALAPDAMPANSFSWVTGAGLYVNLGGADPGTRQTLVGHRNYGFNMFTKSFVTIDGFVVAHTEDRGINIQNGCTDLVVSHNTVSFANSYGIHTVNGQRIRIEGNTVSDCNFHGIGLTAGASGCIVQDNESFRNAHPTIREANGIFLFGAPANTVQGNRLHHNQDTGLQFGTGSDGVTSTNNRSWANGDHGFDHLGAMNTVHSNDVAYGNFMDGFSFEGASPGSKLYNCIAAENGLTTGEFDLWVDGTSSVGFVSDHNLFWNSTAQPPVKFVLTPYALLTDFQVATGLDMHSAQADPRFAAPANADFRLLAGSPAIDAAYSALPEFPALDAAGAPRLDDPLTVDRGAGPLTYADLGAFEFVPPPVVVDHAPIVSSPARIQVRRGQSVRFNVTARDPDGEAITSLVMLPVSLPANSGATFTPNATRTGGTFNWSGTRRNGTYRVGFIAANALADTSVTRISVSGGHDVLVDGVVTTLADEGDITPPVLALSAGFPNPALDAVSFVLDLDVAGPVEFSVFDMQGRRVWSEQDTRAAGRMQLRWSGRASNGQRAGAGLFLVRVRAGDAEFIRRIVRL